MDPYRSKSGSELVAPDPFPIPLDGKWPKRCIKCGAAHAQKKERYTLEREPSWLPLTMLLSPMVYMMLRMGLADSLTVGLRLCNGCRDRFRDAQSAELAFTGIAVVSTILMVTFALNGLWLLFVALVVLTAAGLWYLKTVLIRGGAVRLVEIRQGWMVLSGVHQLFATDMMAAFERRVVLAADREAKKILDKQAHDP